MEGVIGGQGAHGPGTGSDKSQENVTAVSLLSTSRFESNLKVGGFAFYAEKELSAPN